MTKTMIVFGKNRNGVGDVRSLMERERKLNGIDIFVRVKDMDRILRAIVSITGKVN